MGAPSSPSEPPRAARQARSRRTAERIVAAALARLERQTFEQMTVADIAREAGISVGGFYARFASKEALLEHLNVELFGAILAEAGERLSDAHLARTGARGVVEAYVAMAVEGFRRHRRVLQQVALRSRSSGDEGFRARVQATNRALHDRLRQLLRERAHEIHHPDPARAVDVALTAVSGAMREVVLFDEVREGFAPLDDASLVAELVDLFCAYLRIEDER
jgi:AcrR family transcriptional regulator